MKNPVLVFVVIMLASNLLVAQKKSTHTAQYLGISTGYTYRGKNQFTIPLNFEYQIRNKKWGIGVGLGFEDRVSTEGSLDKLYEVGEIVSRSLSPGNSLFGTGSSYMSQHQSFYVVPSISVYHYFITRGKWKIFARTGIRRPINVGYDYMAYTYQAAFNSQNKLEVIDKGPNLFKKSDWRVNWDDSFIPNYDWLLGIGFQYQFNKNIRGFIVPELQIRHGLSVLGGISFKI